MGLKPLSRLGTRLAALVTLVIIGSVMGLALLAGERLRAFGQFAVETNRTHLLAQAESFLAAETHERALHFQNVFRQAEIQAESIARRIEQVLADPELYSQKNYNPGERMRQNPENGVWTNERESLASCVWWNGEKPGRQELRQIAALSHVDPELEQAYLNAPGAAATWFITPSAIARYHPNIHHVQYMPSPAEYDYRNDLCYLIATPRNNPGRKTVWHQVYQDTMGQGLVITVSAPAYSSEGEYLASAGIDISLANILEEFMQADSDSFSGDFSFVLDPRGRIIAFPLDRLGEFGLETGSQVPAGSLLGYTLAESSRTDVSRTAARMTLGRSGVDRLDLDSGAWMVAYSPMPQTGWSLGHITPLETMLTSIRRTEQAVSSASSNLVDLYLLVALVVLVLTVGTLLLVLSRDLFMPLRRIAQTVHQVTTGDLGARTGLERPGELGQLARDLDGMTERIQQQRDSLVRAGELYRGLFTNAVSGLFRLAPQADRFLAVNPAMARMFGFKSPEHMQQLVSDASVLFHDPAYLEQLMATAREQGGFRNQECHCLRADGKELWVDASVQLVNNEHGKPMFLEGSAVDVTDRRRADEYRTLLSRELIRIQENERRRLAVELHDNLAQDLSALKINFAMLLEEGDDVSTATRKRLADCDEKLRVSIGSVRGLAQGLGPFGLGQIGLAGVLREHCFRFESESGIKVDYQASGMNDVRLAQEKAIHAYRIVQEALSNVRQHAGAGRVKVRLVASHPNIILRVEDDGQGFDVDTRTQSALAELRMGIFGMRERVRLLGGQLSLRSRKGRGTVIKVEFPMENTDSGGEQRG